MSLPRSLGPIARLLDQNLPFPVFLRQAHTDHLQYTLFTRLRVASSQNSCRHFSTESPGSGSLEFHRVGDSAVVQPPSVTRAQEAGGQQRQQSYEGIDTKQLILQAALKRVKELGWTRAALEAGCRDEGLSPAAVGMLPSGPAELVQFFIDQCNAELAAELATRKSELSAMRTTDRIKLAVRLRLEMLIPHIDSWPQALGLMAQPSAAVVGCRQLAFIVDEIWHAAGDQATDTSWYTKRALLAGVYSSTELYMLTDYSPEYADTWESLDRRLADVMRLGSAAREARAAASSVAGSLGSMLSWVQQQMQQPQQRQQPPSESEAEGPPQPSAPQWPSKQEPPRNLYTPAPPPSASLRPAAPA